MIRAYYVVVLYETTLGERVLVDGTKKMEQLPAGLEFPSCYPEGCPPDDAQPIEDGTVFFRGVHESPPVATSFRDHVELGLRSDRSVVERRSLSVFTDIDDAKFYRKKFPRVLGPYIARGEMMPIHGSYKHTPSTMARSHCSWWRAKGVVGHTFFVVIDPVPQEVVDVAS